MRKLLIFLFGIISIILFNSCEQETLDSLKNEQNTPVFKYKGVVYFGEIDATVKEKLANLPELATYIDEYGNIEYFDTYEELLKNVCDTNSFSEADLSTRAGGAVTSAYITLYKDVKYKGTSRTYEIYSNGTRWVHVSNLSSIGLYDAISSVKLEIRNPGNPDNFCMLTIWDGVDFKGASLVLRVPTSYITWFEPDLRILRRGVADANWNDVARSFKFNFFEIPTPWPPR